MSKRPLLFALAALPWVGITSLPSKTPVKVDPIADLQAGLQSGSRALAYEPKQGYLRALLKELDIDPRSQVLVFSKTSLQTEYITRKTPRAIYFNDHTYVGWIPGAPLIEVMSVDPVKGVKLYSIPNYNLPKPAFQKESAQCFGCHGGRGGNSALLFANSVQTTANGNERFGSNGYRTTPDQPLDKRWGGWYVSGTHGKLRHQGNESSGANLEKGANITDLRPYFEHDRYLTPHSDIVALMVLELQMAVQNVLSRTVIDTRETLETLAIDVETLVESLLCVGEAKLTAPIQGTAGFAEAYSKGVPRDAKGRSLADLDMKTRVLRYPCSPLVYSPSFAALPTPVRTAVWKRIAEILAKGSPKYSHLSAIDRQAIREILAETRPEFAAALRSK